MQQNIEEGFLNVSQRFEARIGNEVGFLGDLVEDGHKSFMFRTVKDFTPLAQSLNNQAIQSSYRMQIVYLVNLFEPFMQDYIQQRDCLSQEDVNVKGFWKGHLKITREKWDILSKQSTLKNSSTSFMNIDYSLFVLNDRYGIRFPTNLSAAIPELGTLRNCLVHHDGNIESNGTGSVPFVQSLSETLALVEYDNAKIKLNRAFIDKVTYDLQAFVALTGGREYCKMTYD